MEISVLVHQCSLQNMDLVAAFLLMVQILLLTVMKDSLPVHSSCCDFGLVQIVSVVDHDGKITPSWFLCSFNFSCSFGSDPSIWGGGKNLITLKF